MPIAATTQSVAAVVSPRTERPSRMMAPAPRKPIPVTIWAAIRVGSVRTSVPPLVRNSWKPYAETIVKSAAPSETSRCVRMPASRSRSSRSKPTTAPSPPAAVRRRSASQPSSDGTSLTRNRNGLLLEALQLLDAAGREVEQLVEPLALERDLLRGRLDLHEAPVGRHHHVDVDLRGRVLGVVEVEQRRSVDHADRDRCDRPGERLREAEPVERALRRDIRAGDRGAARAAVCLQHVAVEVHGALAERLEVDHAAERSADQSLDLDRASTLLPACRLAVGPLARRRREQRVLGGHPAAARAVEPARHAFLHRRGAEHARLALRPEDDPVRLVEEGRIGRHRPQLVRAPPVVPAHATASSSSTRTRSTSPSGSCRTRSPSERKSSGSPVVRNRYVPSRAGSFSTPLRASVSATSRAVSSAENTSVASRPNVRWNTGRSIG